jgi:hypothetical protein
MYGSPATPAKYPAPATYPAAPAKYEAPAPAKYEAPAPTKYEIPTTTAKYETPAPAKYEAAPKYEEKKEEYSMKPEYKTEEKPMEYKKEEKMEYKKEIYPMKMEYGSKKYRRSIDDEMEEESHSDPIKAPFKLSTTDVKAVRDAVIMKLLSESDPGFGKAFAKEGAGVLGSLIGSKIRGDSSTTASDAAREPGSSKKNIRVYAFTSASDPAQKGKLAGKLAANLAGGVLGGLLSDEKCWRVGLSRKQAKVVRDAVMTQLVEESDPAFRKSFGKAFAKEAAGAVGSSIGSKIRGGDPLSVTVADLVQMYGRDPARGKTAGKLAGRFGAGVLGGLLGNEEALSMEDLEDMMDDMEANKGRWW